MKILKIARNGIIVEVMLPDGAAPPDGVKRKARVARDRILPVRPPPAPLVRTMPPGGEFRMLGEPAGRIPTVMPKPWDPMIMVGDIERAVHAVPAGTRAKCGYKSSTGWQWARGQDVTCEHCWQRITEEEFERDGIVQHMRKCGHTGPITREDYIGFNWAGCSIRPWTADHEDSLPALLQDWPLFYKNAPRRARYSERKYGAWASEQVDALVAALHKKQE